MAQLSNAVGDTQEAMGEALSPVVENLSKFFKIAAEEAGDFIKQFTQTPMQRTIDEMAEMGMETAELEKTFNELRQAQIMEEFEGHIIGSVQAQAKLTAGTNKLTEALTVQGVLAKEEGDFELVKNDLSRRERRAKEKEFDRRQEEIDKEKDQAREIIEHATMQIQLNQELNALKEDGKRIDDDIILNNAESSKADKAKIKLNREAIKGKELYKKKIEEISKEEGLADIKEALRTVYGIASDAFRWGTKKGGPFLGAAMGALGFAAGYKYYEGVQSAQYGADFVTDGPQMMLVGEGSGPEHVQVTPLSDPNIDGPQGSGMTINIQGSVIGTEEFTEQVLMPQIEEGLRLGNNI